MMLLKPKIMARHKRNKVIGASICAIICTAGAVAAGSEFPTEQIEKGRSLYVDNCSGCHATSLTGAAHNPALSGADFLSHWRGKTSRSEEHTSELQSLMRISYAVFCLTKKPTIAESHARSSAP